MIEQAAALQALLPGDLTEPACDLRPLLRHGLHRRLHMHAIQLRVHPERCDDPAGFATLLHRIDAQPRAWRDRFFDDVDVAAWIFRIGRAPLTGAPPTRVVALRHLVDRPRGEDRQGTDPIVFAADRPPNLAAAIQDAAASDGLDLGKSPVTKDEMDRLQTRIGTALASLSTVWPGMAAAVRQHVAAIVIVDAPVAISNLSFAGTVVWGSPIILNSDRGSAANFDESLVHETIHQMLYCFQEVHPLIKQGTVGTFKSPWSGRERPMAVLAHIPLVYYAMLEYMDRLRQVDAAIEPGLRERKRKIVVGLDAFFRAALGQSCLTSRGCALHDQIRVAFESRRAALM